VGLFQNLAGVLKPFPYNSAEVVMKTCTLCKKPKVDSQFSFRNKAKNRRASWCKECYAERNKKHYEDNKASYRQRALEWKRNYRKDVYKFLFEYFETHLCVDCGETDPVVLDFDHQRDKQTTISKMIRNQKPIEAIKKEMAKCEVRCANCHRRKTAKDFGWYAVMEIGGQ
jgi:hypothetical protein